MFLHSCLPTLSHSISWGNWKGIWLHKSHVEPGVAKSCTFDLRINITNQCWAPKEKTKRNRLPTPRPVLLQNCGFDLIFIVSKSHSPESLVIKGQVRQRHLSPLRWVTPTWQHKSPLWGCPDKLLDFLYPQSARFVIQPRVVCTLKGHIIISINSQGCWKVQTESWRLNI